MSIASETCYECGRDIPDGLGQPASACVGTLPGGTFLWSWVDVCPECALKSQRRSRLWLAFACVLVALLTFAVACPLMR